MEKYRSNTRQLAGGLPYSGDPSPSADDVAVTRELVKAGQILDIEVLDHLVIGDGRHVSLRRRGLGFS